MSDISIKQSLRNFIISNFMVSAENSAFSDADSLLRKGIIDSMGVMELVNFTQKNFAIKIEPKEITPQNFDSLDSLERYIRSKNGKPSA